MKRDRPPKQAGIKGSLPLLVVWVLQYDGTEQSCGEVSWLRWCGIGLVGFLPWLEIAQGGTATDTGNQQDQ